MGTALRTDGPVQPNLPDNTFSQSLVSTLENTRVLVDSFASMIRKEFFHTPYVLHTWRTLSFPYLRVAIERVRLLAFAADFFGNAEPDFSKKWQLLTPSILEVASFRSNSFNARFAGYLASLINKIDQHLDGANFPTGRVLPPIAHKLRQAQLLVDDISFTLVSWLKILKDTYPKVSDAKFVVKTPQLSQNIISFAGVAKDAFRDLDQGVDIVSICLDTRLAFLAAVTSAFFQENTIENLVSVSSLHEMSKEVCDRLRPSATGIDRSLLAIAEKSIAWRHSRLIPTTIGKLKNLGHENLDDLPVVQFNFRAPNNWVKNPIRYCIDAGQSDAPELYGRLSCVAGLMGVQFIDGDRDCDIRVQLGQESNLAVMPNGGLEFKISETALIDDHWFKSSVFTWIRSQSGGNAPLELFEEEVASRRHQALLEFANTTVRIRSTVELGRMQLQLVDLLENIGSHISDLHASGMSGRAKVVRDKNPSLRNEVLELFSGNGLGNNFEPKSDWQRWEVAYEVAKTELEEERDFCQVPKWFHPMMSRMPEMRIKDHGFTKNSFDKTELYKSSESIQQSEV